LRGLLVEDGAAQPVEDVVKLVGCHVPRPRRCGHYRSLPAGAGFDRSFADRRGSNGPPSSAPEGWHNIARGVSPWGATLSHVLTPGGAARRVRLPHVAPPGLNAMGIRLLPRG